jgi:hypothetical protein
MRTAAFAVFVLTAVWCGWFVLIWASALARGVGGGLVNVLLIPAAVVALVGIATGFVLLWFSKRSS